ncbi:MAG: glycosyltransferase [Candidatus Wallbacteria bacterium]|nr:glycosyltransferase [Candidatus Wallbacteria bacterium]
MLFSLIVPYYDHPEIVSAFIRSAVSLDFPRDLFELILIDDGSNQPLPRFEIPADFKIKHLHISHSGRAKARNTGIAEAQGQHLLFLDSDVIATPELLQAHRSFLNQHPGCAVLGRIDFPPGLTPDPLTASSDLPQFFSNLRHAERLTCSQFLTCNLLVERHAVSSAGGFCEKFTEYGYEDLELGWRLCSKNGLQLLYNSKALAYHHHERDLSALTAQQISLGKGQLVFHLLHPESRHTLRMEIDDFLNILAIGQSQHILYKRSLLEEKIRRTVSCGDVPADQDLDRYKQLCRICGIAESVLQGIRPLCVSPDCFDAAAAVYPSELLTVNPDLADIILETPDQVSLFSRDLVLISLQASRAGRLSFRTAPDTLISRYRTLRGYWNCPPETGPSGRIFIKGSPDHARVPLWSEFMPCLIRGHENPWHSLRRLSKEAAALPPFPASCRKKMLFLLSFFKIPAHWVTGLVKGLSFSEALVFPLLDKLVHLRRMIRSRRNRRIRS